MTEVTVVLVLRTRVLAIRSLSSASLMLSMIDISALAIVIPYLKPVTMLFGFEALPLSVTVSLLLVVLGYFAATEVTKRYFYKT